MVEDVEHLLGTVVDLTPPPSLVHAEGEHVARVDRGPDPLDTGFSLAGGLLAPLPATVRLPDDADLPDDEVD